MRGSAVGADCLAAVCSRLQPAVLDAHFAAAESETKTDRRSLGTLRFVDDGIRIEDRKVCLGAHPGWGDD